MMNEEARNNFCIPVMPKDKEITLVFINLDVPFWRLVKANGNDCRPRKRFFVSELRLFLQIR